MRDVPSTAFARVLLWLFVINLGIALGAGLFESRIVVPQWLVHSPDTGSYFWDAEAVREANTGVRFWAYVTTGPLTILTLANLIVAWRSRGPLRRWWLTAAIAELVGRVMTFAYFIPTMIELMGGSLPQTEAVEVAQQWVGLNSVRHALGIVALLAALKAFSLAYAQRRE